MKKLITVTFCAFGALPLIPNPLKGIPIYVLFILSLILVLNSKNTVEFPYKKVTITSILYLILLPSLFYTDNKVRIDIELSSRIPLLLIPITLGLLNKSKFKVSQKILLKLCNIYIISGLIFAVIIIVYLGHLGVFSNRMSLHDSMAFLNNEMLPINQHAIYASIFIAIPLIFSMQKFLKSQILRRDLVFLLLEIIPMVFALILMAKKGVLIAIVATFIFLIFYYSNSLKNRLIIIMSLGLLLVFIFQVPRVNKLFSELINPKSYNHLNLNNSTSIRNVIYNCALSKIEESPIFGYGLGDVKNELKRCYQEHNFFNSPNEYYNTHNQYLSYYLASGIFGLLTVLFFFTNAIFKGVKEHNGLLIALVVFFAIVMLFENILERQSGLIIFSFLMTSLYFYEKK